MVAHGIPTLYALDSVHKFKAQGFWPLKSPRESISDAQIILSLEMNLEKKRVEEYYLMSLASILLKRPFSWLSLLAPPLLHILGLRFLHLLLTCVALFFSSFFFPISLPPPSIQASKQVQEQEQEQEQDQEQEQEQDQEQEQEQEQDRDYVAIHEDIITPKSEDNIETTNGEVEDNAIPDDESLIELSLPSGHYIGHHYTSSKNHIYLHNNKVQDFKLFDLFINDFIEEDNLIEIDISIGSIKYSRFEIKA
ncbi:hypothetical protein CARUB_v10015246mg [Capsella rubella]|uniref:Uncharacterized protein n=1 Tax=Capsella rubella TaxID=81985 RepID=R0I2A7_9BRAS|nr:hypothetical protein CARUB_v10015246mg [Capsella rubella]